MTETLLSTAYGLSCGSLAFHIFAVVVGNSWAWPGVGFFFVCAIVSSLLKSSYGNYKEVK